MNMDNNTGRMPLVIAVTGHRDVDTLQDSRDHSTISEAFTACLQYWLKTVGPDTPIHLLCGMAQGADLLALKAAMQLKSAGARITPLPCLVAPLPQLKESYDNQEDFEYALEICEKYGCTITAPSLSAMSDMDEAYPYLYQGAVFTRYANVVIALWDSKPAKGHGGTADVVRMQLGDIPDIPEIKALFPKGFDGSNGGVVQHIPVTRCRPSSDDVDISYPTSPLKGSPYPVYLSCSHHQSVQDFLSHEFTTLLEQIRLFNRKHKVIDTQKAERDNAQPGLTPALSQLFHYADTKAVKRRDRYQKSVMTFFFCAFTALLALEFVEWGVSSTSGYIATGIVLFALITCIGLYWTSRFRGWKRDYQLYRGVAEAIRLRGYLNLADIAPCESSLLPRQMRNNLPLFQQAVYLTEWAWWQDKSIIAPDKVKDAWMESQISYLKTRLTATPGKGIREARKIHSNLLKMPGHYHRTLGRLSKFLMTSFVVLLTSLFTLQLTGTADYYTWLYLGIKVMLFTSGILALWINLAGYEHLCVSYSRLIALYQRAATELENTSDYHYTLQELAKEAFSEHCEWVYYNAKSEYNSGH